MASYFKRVAKISKNLSLVEVSKFQPESNVTKTVELSVNHIICIDVSGSMYSVLPSIITQLKSRLVEIVGNNDSVTIIWFNQTCGFVGKMLRLSSVDDVRSLNSSLNSLKSSGCTNFLSPIEMANSLVSSIKTKDNSLWNFFFMSDGGHNTGGRWGEVLDALDKIKPYLSNSVICEYGYWADTNALNEMSDSLGGVKIFSKDFNEYKVDFEKSIKSKISESRVKLDISDFKHDMKLQFMLSIDEENNVINTYSTERVSEIYIPSNVNKLYYISVSKSDNVPTDLKPLYAISYALFSRMKYDLAEEVLYGTKDKEMIDGMSNSYGKERLFNFGRSLESRVFSSDLSSVVKTDLNYKPNYRRYCVLDFIDDLINDNSVIHLTHPDFKYNLISAKSVESVTLTDEDKTKLSKSNTKTEAEKVINEASRKAVKMEYKDESLGYPMSSLVWNTERANLSVAVNIPVILTKLVNGLNKTKESKIARNYNLIKDGVINTPSLIITTSSSLASKFKRMKLITTKYNDNMYMVDISSLPITNRSKVKSVSSRELAELEIQLLRIRCINKYVSYLIKKHNSFKSPISNKMNEDPEFNISNGFYSPKKETVKSNDFYVAPFLETKIEKFSNLPKIEDVFRKLKSKVPMTPSEEYMSGCIKEIDEKTNSGEGIESLASKYKDVQKKLSSEISEMKFSLIVSRKWFSDKSGFNDDTVKVNIGGNSLNVVFSFSEKVVNL